MSMPQKGAKKVYYYEKNQTTLTRINPPEAGKPELWDCKLRNFTGGTTLFHGVKLRN